MSNLSNDLLFAAKVINHANPQAVADNLVELLDEVRMAVADEHPVRPLDDLRAVLDKIKSKE